MNSKRVSFFTAANLLIVFVNAVLVVYGVAGCSQNPADWKPEDPDKIRKLVSEISDARRSEEKLATLFSADALPDRTWLKKTKDLSFVVSDISIDGDLAKVNVDLENHFGEIQSSVEWACERSGDEWVIIAAPFE